MVKFRLTITTKETTTNMQAIPGHGPCLVCGTENPHSFGIHWFSPGKGIITGKITLTEKQQGPPNFAHGGATAALVDEAMGASVWHAGYTVVSVNLNIDYKKGVPLGQEIQVTGQVDTVDDEGKVIKAKAEIRLQDGEIAVTAIGTYVNAPQFFEKLVIK